jgi:hypothetical protein
MVLELVAAAYISCGLAKVELTSDNRHCLYRCPNGQTEVANTLPQFQCPKKLSVAAPKIKRDQGRRQRPSKPFPPGLPSFWYSFLGDEVENYSANKDRIE